jgi:signal transduction histidine kinase
MAFRIQNLKSKIESHGGGERLVRNYFLTSVILISGALVTSGLLEVYFHYQESWEHFGLIQKEVTAGAAFKIETFVDEIESSMTAATKTREIVRDGLSPEYQWELRRLLVNTPAITQVVAFDLQGVERAAAMRSGSVLAKSRWDPPAAAVFEKITHGDSYFSPVHFAGGIGPFMTIGVPIERFAGEVIGVLQAEIDLKHVWQVIAGVQVGKAGYAYLVARSGYLIAHPDISLVLQERNLAHLRQVKEAFQPSSDRRSLNALVAESLLGKKVFCSYALIPSLNWAVLTELPIGEVYAPLYASMLRTSGLLLAGLGVALFATLLVRYRIVRPLEDLRHGVERIRSGDLTARLDLETGDELEMLSTEFNEMAANLKEAYSNLEQKVAERTEALTVMNQKLEDASKHKSQFLSRVNHELRTPISAIIGYARLILRETQNEISPLQKENLQDLQHNAERLLGMINDLLDLAKIEAGRMDVRIEPVNIYMLINEALSTIAPMLKHDRVRIIRDIDPGLPRVNTDQEKLRQIFLNLLGNAAKFTEGGEIGISAAQGNGFLKLAVSDTGVGIEKGEQAYIFEEFRRGGVRGDRKFSGSGLGLAIVKKFVNLLGGDIAVESEPGKGSTFTITLPLERGERAEKAQTSMEKEQAILPNTKHEHEHGLP